VSVVMDGVELLRQLAEAAKKHRMVYAANLTLRAPVRAFAAQWLRERGVPIVAVRARQNSKWYLLRETDPDALKKQWRDRIVSDAYAELVRACQALSGLASGKKERLEFQAFAVQIGSWLGKDPSSVITETRPLKMSDTVRTILDDVDRTLSGP
jgi:hypothetical protein